MQISQINISAFSYDPKIFQFLYFTWTFQKSNLYEGEFLSSIFTNFGMLIPNSVLVYQLYYPARLCLFPTPIISENRSILWVYFHLLLKLSRALNLQQQHNRQLTRRGLSFVVVVANLIEVKSFQPWYTRSWEQSAALFAIVYEWSPTSGERGMNEGLSGSCLSKCIFHVDLARFNCHRESKSNSTALEFVVSCF